DPLGRYVLLKNVPFEVIGVLAAKGANAFGNDQDDVALVPLSTGFMRLFGKQYLRSINVKVDSVDNMTTVQDAITELLKSR
ncbi:ABC transporter permease, partial [Acinetobacter baumannii]